MSFEIVSKVTSLTGIIGNDATSLGQVMVDGAGAVWAVQDSLIIGLEGDGTLDIMNGGKVSNVNAAVGTLAGSSGVINISGPGSTWNTLQNIQLQRGTISVTNGGTLSFISPLGIIFLSEGGQITGDGVIGGSVSNFGSISPGTAGGETGTMTIMGLYEQTSISPKFGNSSGELHIDIDGTTGSHDKLSVGSVAFLGGGLFVDVITGIMLPQDGIPINVLTTPGSPNGVFDVVFTTGLTADKLVAVGYGAAPAGGGGGVAGPLPGSGVTINILTINDFQFNENGAGPITGGVPSNAVLADFDFDPIDPLNNNGPDLALTIPGIDQVFILFNNGTDASGWLGFGALQTSITVGNLPSDLVASDFDGDGNIDLAVTNAGSNNVTILLLNAAGGLAGQSTTIVGNAPSAIDAGDLNGDTFPDLVVTNADDNTISVLINQGLGGNGNFNIDPAPIAVGVNPVDVALGNFDGTTGLDAAVVNAADGTLIVLGGIVQGSALVTTTIDVGTNPGRVDPADKDNDKDIDFVVSNAGTLSLPSDVSIIINDQNTGFLPAVNLPVGANQVPTSIENVDVDGDGDSDIAIVVDDINTGTSAVRIFRNDFVQTGQLNFVDIGDFAVGTDPLFVLGGDVDQDGQTDVVTVNDQTAGPGGGAAGSGGVAGPLPPPDNVVVLLLCDIPGDTNCDGLVDVTDLLTLLGGWGPCPLPCPPTCDADTNDDCVVDVTDLLTLLGNWG